MRRFLRAILCRLGRHRWTWVRVAYGVEMRRCRWCAALTGRARKFCAYPISFYDRDPANRASPGSLED